MKTIYIYIIVISLFSLSCEKDIQSKNYIARVGDSYLTQEELEDYIGSMEDQSNIRFHSFVNRWLENELLYQEALKYGLEKSPDIEKRLAEVRKQLAVQLLLDKEVYADTGEISIPELKEYYEKHLQEFLLREDAVRVNIAAFNERQPANEFRTLIVKEKTWEDALVSFQEKKDNTETIQSFISNQVFSQLTLFPAELWKIVQNLSKEDISFPVKIGELYYIVQLLDKYTKGAIADFDVVKNEVRTRVMIDNRRTKYNKYISSLRKKYNVELKIPETISNDKRDKVIDE